MTVKERRRFTVKQDEEERKTYDSKWNKISAKLK